MNSPPESSSDLEQISSTQISVEKVVEEERLDFIDDAARLDPKECVKRLGSPQGNIFHFAARKGKVEFMDKAIKKLPRPVIQSLLCQSSKDKQNPLHIAAANENHKMVKIILDFYRSSASSSEAQSTTETNGEKPWLALDLFKNTPLQLALERGYERIALEILSMDVESLSGMEDSEHRGPLFMAMANRLYQVAHQILTSAPNCSLRGHSGQTVLFLAAHAPDHIFYRLVEKDPHLIIGQDDYDKTVLAHWVMSGTLHPVEYVVNNDKIAPDLRRDFIDQLSRTNEWGYNPLHEISGLFNDDALSVKMAEVLVNAYKRERAQLFSSAEFQPPWLMKNKAGDTPLRTAIKFQNEQLASYLLSLDPIKFLENDDDLLFYSIEHKCPKVADDILGIVLRNASLLIKLLTCDGNGQNALHFVRERTEVISKLIVERWPELINGRDKDIRTPLETASTAGASWLVELILQKDRSWIHEAPLAWVPACKGGHLSTILAFVDKSSIFKDLCHFHRDTPLHHIKGVDYKDYKALLDHEQIKGMKNMQNANGETPLHVAIKSKNIELAEILLKMDEVDRTIKDNNQKTAMDLLEATCNEDAEWKQMCDLIGVDPTSRTTYKADLAHMRDIISVVAILLATITFTAGFTLPGGVDNSGQAVFAAKAAFIVFIVSDGYAMCCSMLALFCIMWSMVFKHHTSSLLINRSMVLLKQSLYGTLIAFMTGVYCVVHRKSLWVAIVIFSMCSVVIIASNESVLTGDYLQWRCRWMKRRREATLASDRVEAQLREPLNNQPQQELASIV